MANFNLNKVILGGRLTADPELRTTPNGVSVTSFTVAVNRNYAKDTDEVKADFFNCTAWRGTAEFITKFFRKSSSICVMGYQQNKSWVDEQGIKRFGSVVVVEEAYFVDAKGEAQAKGFTPQEPPAGYYGKAGNAPVAGTSGQTSPGAGSAYGEYAPISPGNFADLENGEELPF